MKLRLAFDLSGSRMHTFWFWSAFYKSAGRSLILKYLSVECPGDSGKHRLPAEWADLTLADCTSTSGSTQLLCALDTIGHVATGRQQDAALGSQADQALIIRA